MLVVRDENKIRGSLSSLSNCSSFISTALSLSVWQDSRWSDMSAFNSETTTTNEFDGRLLSFPVRTTSAAICRKLIDNRDKRFLCPFGEHANVSCQFKNETGSWTTRRSFFFIFPSSGLSKMEESRLSDSLRLNSSDTPIVHSSWVRHVYNVGSINGSVIRVNKCARRNGLKLQSANKARGMRFI